MRWSLVLAFCFSLCVLPALAQENSSPPDVDELEQQLAQADRQLEDYDQSLSDLNEAAGQSSDTGRSSAIEDLERIQQEVIQKLERLLGEDYTIEQHGEEVQEVTTDEAEKETSFSTSRRERTLNQQLDAEGVGSPGYRLVRMQQIYESLQEIRQSAIDHDPGALDRYSRMAREFGGLMLYDRDAIFGQLPPEAQQEYMETMKP